MSSAQLSRLGITRGRLRSQLAAGNWQRLATGLFLTRPDAPTRSDWIRAGLLLAGPRAALSGWDAVAVRGIGARRPPHATVLILTTGGMHRVVGNARLRPTRRVYVGELAAGWDADLAGVPVVGVARAVADTALTYRWFAPVRALVTQAIQRGLCSVDELIAEVAACPRNHSGHLRRSLGDLVAGAHSIAEAEAIAVLRERADIPPFEANAELILDGVVFRPDLLWRELRAIAEIDSREFHFSEAQWKATMRRHNALSRAGFVVAHYAPSDVRARGAAWGAEVADWLRARAAELRRPHP